MRKGRKELSLFVECTKLFVGSPANIPSDCPLFFQTQHDHVPYFFGSFNTVPYKGVEARNMELNNWIQALTPGGVDACGTTSTTPQWSRHQGNGLTLEYWRTRQGFHSSMWDRLSNTHWGLWPWKLPLVAIVPMGPPGQGWKISSKNRITITANKQTYLLTYITGKYEEGMTFLFPIPAPGLNPIAIRACVSRATFILFTVHSPNTFT